MSQTSAYRVPTNILWALLARLILGQLMPCFFDLQTTYSDSQMDKPQLHMGGWVNGWVGEWVGG